MVGQVMIATPWLWTWGIAVLVLLVAKWALARSYGRVTCAWWGWPGMHPEQFHASVVGRPDLAEVERTVLYMAIGALLLWGMVPSLEPNYATAVLGMLALGLLLHFGVVRLLSIFWRALGRDARPLFDRPLAARTLGEFWGRRWNRGFSDVAHRWIFRPLAPRVGAMAASAVVFLASGVGHDVLLSLPAGGWFGSCTAYFALQWCGLWFERRRAPSRLRTLAVVLLPAPLLFHPPLLERVVLPFLTAIGALA